MRRVITAALVSGMLATAALAATAASWAAGESGPKCADITGETHNFAGTGTERNQPPYTFAMELILAAPACKQVTYTVYIIQDPGTDPIAVDQTGVSSEGRPQFTTTLNDDDPNICVFATAASNGGKVHDRAPDATATPDCLALQAPASGGGSGFQ